MLGVWFSQSWIHEAVPGMKCTRESSNPSVGLCIGTSSILQLETTNWPPQTMPMQGWKLVFGSLFGMWLEVSQPFRNERGLASDQTPSQPIPWEVTDWSCLPRFFFSVFIFIYLYQWMSGKSKDCYFHLEQATRYHRGKSFLLPFSLNLQK